MTDKPGRELPKDYRAIAADLVASQGWRYEIGKGHAKLIPPDKDRDIVIVSTTPTRDPRSLRNFVAKVRRSGGKV